MRKGMTIIEMLALIMVLAILSVPLARLSRATLRDIPAMWRMVQINTRVIEMLEQMHGDIDFAEALPDKFGKYEADEKTLLIESKGTVVCYQLKDEKIVRYETVADSNDGFKDTATWPVPEAKVEWRLLYRGDKAYAVEVQSYIAKWVGERLEKKFANSHLYFAGALEGGVQ